MILITDTAGNDIVSTPPPALTLLTSGVTAACRIRYRVVELSALPQRAISSRVHWGDGAPDSIVTGTGTLDVDVVRALPVGAYTVNVYAADMALPVPAEASVNMTVNVLPNPQIATPENVVFGPVLPRDAGYPGPKDWLFNTGHDIGVLESSLKMLLTTAKGERVMEPEYGTLLRQMLFDPITDSLKSAVREEIVRTVALWEPRVDLSQIDIVVDAADPRQVTVNLGFVSKINNQSVDVTLQFKYA